MLSNINLKSEIKNYFKPLFYVLSKYFRETFYTKMADPIKIIGNILDTAEKVHKIVTEVQKFPDLATDLNDKISLYEPGLMRLKEILPPKMDPSKRQDPLFLYIKALRRMLVCTEEVFQFMDYIRDMNMMEKIIGAVTGKVREWYDKLDDEIDTLTKAIMFNVGVMNLTTRVTTTHVAHTQDVYFSQVQAMTEEVVGSEHEAVDTTKSLVTPREYMSYNIDPLREIPPHG